MTEPRYTVQFHGTAGSWFVHDAEKSNISFGREFKNGVIDSDEIAEQLNEKDTELDALRLRADALEAALKEIREVACGETQVAEDDTEGMAYIYRRITALLTPHPVAPRAEPVTPEPYPGPGADEIVYPTAGTGPGFGEVKSEMPKPSEYARRQIDAIAKQKRDEREGKT